MKEYIEYMDGISVTPDLHARIMERVKQAQAAQTQTTQVQTAQEQTTHHAQAAHEQSTYAQTTQKAKPIIRIGDFRRYAAPLSIAAACMVVVGLTIFAAPQLFGTPDVKTPAKFGDSMLLEPDDENLRTNDNANDDGQSGNVALTYEQALSDADFGAYVSMSAPAQFNFSSAQKSSGQIGDSLSVMWKDAESNSDGCIAWKISKTAEDEYDRVVNANEREKYDTSLYTFPWDTSVPENLQGYFENPLFRLEDLTLDTIQARAYHTDDDLRETLGLRMEFSVLYGDVVVIVNTKGMSPEQLFKMLTDVSAVQKNNKVSDFDSDNLASADER